MGVKLKGVRRLLLVLILALVASIALGQSSLVISESKIDITPPERLPLGGYTARKGETMRAGGDPLYARCLVFRSGELVIAVVSAEMLTIPHSLADAVRKEIPSNVHLFLSATHTHSAPDSQMLNDRMTFEVPGIATFKHRWLAWYANKIASAVNGALNAPGENVSKLEMVQFKEPLNRGRRPKAKPDTLATALQARFGLQKRAPFEDLFLEYAAHAVFYGPERNQTSGDWPSQVSARVESAEVGAVFPVLEGAIGDVSPHAAGATASDRIDNFTNIMLSGLEHNRRHAVGVWETRDKPHAIRWLTEPLLLDPPTPSQAFVTDYHVPMELAQIMVNQFAPPSANISAFRLGSMAILGVPGEPTSWLGRRIREAGLAMGFKSVLVVSHVNGWIGYILDPKDYARGGYEASLSLNGPLEGEHVVAACIKALKGLRGK